MKGKKWISFLVVCICALVSMGILSFYDRVEGNAKSTHDSLERRLEEELPYVAMALLREIDPDYEAVRFHEDVSDEVKEEVDYYINRRLTYARSILQDENLQYRIYDEKGKTQLQSKTYVSEKEALFDEDYEFDENGASLDSLYVSYLYHDAALINYSSYFDFYLPQDLVLNIRVPSDYVKNNLLMQTLIEDWQNYAPFSAVMILGASVLILLVMLVVPCRLLKESEPFVTLAKIKGELLIIGYSTLISLGALGIFVLCGCSIGGNFQTMLKGLGMINSKGLLLVVNVIAWTLYLYLVACTVFSIKYIFHFGFVRYLKERTVIGWAYRRLGDAMNAVSEIDLAQNADRKLLKLMLLHGLLIALLCFFFVFGAVLAFVYVLVLFFWCKRKLQKIQLEYEGVLQQAHQIASSDFKEPIAVNSVMFSSLQAELQGVQIGFAHAVEEETRSQNMKTELISNVSHDLKTPLTGIMNYAELLQQDSIPDAQRIAFSKQLHLYAKRLQALIDDLFEVSKVNSGDISLDFAELDLGALVQQVLAENMDLFEQNQLELIGHYPDTPCMVLLDGSKTYRIFENLFSNIGKYALPGTRVYLDVEDLGHEVRVTLRNIAKEAMHFNPDEITERFVRGDRSRHEEGSGLGLAIIKSFTEVQKGSFQIILDGDLFKSVLVFAKVDEKSIV